MRVIYLTGVKHAGKTELGTEAARILSGRFVDTDELILGRLQGSVSSVRELYRREGKEAFMAKEREALSAYLTEAPCSVHIIATGGGACDNEPLIALMRASGKIIYLKVAEETLYERILRTGIPPFLEGDDPRGAFHALYARRDALYSRIADFVLPLCDCKSVQENGALLAAHIAHIIGDEESWQAMHSERQ